MNTEWIVPDWPAPAGVRSLVTTRAGGVSAGAHASLNLGAHVGDDAARVSENRRRLSAHLPCGPVWLDQVHGNRVVDADSADGVPRADAAFSRRAGTVCAVMVADCLPVLFCDRDASVVAAAHAGWRGLAGGVLEASVRAMPVPPDRLLAYLGPAIGPASYEVGDDVREAFVRIDPSAESAFRRNARGRWLADLYALARRRLERAGLARIHGGGFDTFADPERFFSFRRDGQTGRMAALVWRD